MEILCTFLKTFLVGGVLCAIGQILVDRTSLTPARILTMYVVAGVVLGAVGLYQPFADWAGAGATIPLTGFGNTLAKGVKEAVAERGLLGAFTGGLTASAAGICAAIVFGWAVAERGLLGAFTGGLTASAAGICAAIIFGWAVAALFKPKDKN